MKALVAIGLAAGALYLFSRSRKPTLGAKAAALAEAHGATLGGAAGARGGAIGGMPPSSFGLSSGGAGLAGDTLNPGAQLPGTTNGMISGLTFAGPSTEPISVAPASSPTTLGFRRR